MAFTNPTFLQTREYSALNDRVAHSLSGAVQPGVYYNQLLVSERATGGSNMSVDVALGYASIFGNSAGNGGMYTVGTDSVTNLAVTASHATLPRIDQIVFTVRDSVHGGDASDVPEFQVLRGTATSGATLANRTGAVVLPSNSIRLADILIPAASTRVVNANIRDRRQRARGQFYVSGNTSLSTNASVAPGNVAANGAATIECAGCPIDISWAGSVINSVGDATVALYLDSSLVTSIAGKAFFGDTRFVYTPPAGQHLFEIRFWGSGITTVYAGQLVLIEYPGR